MSLLHARSRFGRGALALCVAAPRPPRGLAGALLAAVAAVLVAAPAANADWEVALAQSPTHPTAPWQDWRGLEMLRLDVDGDERAEQFVVATYNNIDSDNVPDGETGVQGDSACVVYRVSPEGEVGAVASKIYQNGLKAKAVATDSRGLVYVALNQGTVDVLAFAGDGQGGFELDDLESPIDLGGQALGYLPPTEGPWLLEGVAVRESPEGTFLYATERVESETARIFKVDVTTPAEPARDQAFGLGGFVDLTFQSQPDLRGLTVDPAGRLWVAAHAAAQVFVINAEGTALLRSFPMAGPNDVAHDGQYVYVTLFGGADSAVLQIDQAAAEDERLEPIDLSAPGFFDVADGSGGLSGIGVSPGPFGEPGALFVAVEEVDDALEGSFGGRDGLITNGLPTPGDVTLRAVDDGALLEWSFADADVEDVQAGYVVRFFSEPGGTGEILLETSASSTDQSVFFPIKDVDQKIPRSVTVTVIDPAGVFSQTAILNSSRTLEAQLAEGTRLAEGGACSVGPGGPPADPWALLPALLALAALGLGRRREVRLPAKS